MADLIARGLATNAASNTKLKNFIPDANVPSLFTVNNLSSIKYLRLYGFDKTKPHRIRVLARNNASFNYRIVISAKTGASWGDVFDTTSTFVVTENVGGLTKIDYSIGTKRLVMYIDYSVIFNGDSVSDTDLVNSKWNISPDCHVYESSLSVPSKKMVATKNGTTAQFKFRYNTTQNMVVEFGLLGINQLAHLKKIYKENANTLTDSFDSLVTFSTINTDWVSPYGLAALTNITFPGNAFTTVGGNHGTTADTGFATARRQEVNFYADGVLMQDNQVYYCDEITVKAVHYIAAANVIDPATGAKRDSVKEDVVYTITPRNMEVSVTLTALEDVRFSAYTGLQSTLSEWNDEGYFMIDTAATSYPNIGGAIVNSATKTQADSDRFVVRKATDMLIGYTNRRVGIGNRAYVGASTPNISFSASAKAYMQNVLGATVDVLTGGTICWNGGWTLTEALPCSGSKAAYFINYLGKRVYCVDFFAAGSGYLEVLPEDYNKEIELVLASSGVTYDTFIVSKGLKVDATGYGQLKFTVK